MKTIVYLENCPDCGKLKGPVFHRGRSQLSVNKRCVCQKKHHGLGYDSLLETRILENPVFFAELTSSGIESKWQKDAIRCAFCGREQFRVPNGSTGKNIKCLNPDCPSLGFDYEKHAEKVRVTASGIVNNVADYFKTRYQNLKLSTKQPIDKYSASP